MAFVKAVKKKSKLRLALTGPSGSGKTWGALQVAKGLGGRIACIDTEKGSASLYDHIVDFDVMELSAPYTPEAYIAGIKEAEKAGYDVLIIDSTTHEWSGPGGVLELVDDVARAKYKGNSWSAWNEMTPRHRAFIDTMLQSNMHIIATGRSKTETAQVEEGGRKKVVKLGMKTEQRDGFEYEFTVVLDLVHDGYFALASKDRTGLFVGDAKPLSDATGVMLREWLENGATGPEPSKAQKDLLEELKEAYKGNTDEMADALRTFSAFTGNDGTERWLKLADIEKPQPNEKMQRWIGKSLAELRKAVQCKE